MDPKLRPKLGRLKRGMLESLMDETDQVPHSSTLSCVASHDFND